jgi:MFS family permease
MQFQNRSPENRSLPMPATATDRMSHRALVMLFVLCGAAFLEGVDVAMLNVAIPSIRSDLGLDAGSLHWVVSAYVLGYGGFMLLGGRAADLFGRRRMFIVPLAFFVVFSGLGGLATEGWVLVTARFVTGLAAAFMAPAGLSIITTSIAEGPARDKALLVYAATGAGGYSLGLVLGGLLTTISWRWVFFAPVVMAAVILALAIVLLERDEPVRRGERPRFDVGGAVTVTAAMLLAVFAITHLERHDGRWLSLVAGLAAVALLAAFVALERRSPAPLVRLGLLRNGALVRANLVALLFAAGFFGFQFVVTLYLQDLRGWSTIETSLALLVVGSDAILAPTLTPRLVRRFGNGRVIVGGLVLAVIAYALFLPVGPDWTYAAMFPTMVLIGVAFALTYGPFTIVATSGVAEHEQGLASGVLYTSFQFGAALGLALVTVARGQGTDLLAGYHRALVVPLVAVGLATIIGLTGLRATRRPASIDTAPELADAA